MNIGWKVAAGLAVALVLALIYGRWEAARADGYRGAVDKYADAQKTNLETIDALENRVKSLVAQDAEKSDQARETAERNKRMFDSLNEALKKRQTVRETVYVHDKSAGDWAATGVPPAVADSLR